MCLCVSAELPLLGVVSVGMSGNISRACIEQPWFRDDGEALQISELSVRRG